MFTPSRRVSADLVDFAEALSSSVGSEGWAGTGRISWDFPRRSEDQGLLYYYFFVLNSGRGAVIWSMDDWAQYLTVVDQ